MKTIIIFISGLILSSFVFSQTSFHDDPDHMYCSHKQKFLNESFAAKSVVDPLLNNYDVKFYFLNIEVENTSVYVAGNVTINSEVTSVILDTFAFELVDELNIDSVFIDGMSHSFLHSSEIAHVPLQNPLSAGDNFSVQIYYHGFGPTGGFFSGITTKYSEDWDKDVTWTLSEPYAAKSWWPCKQDLQDKADSCWVFLTTDENNMAGSQGLLTAVTPMPNNKNRYEWKSNYPIDYYLISFAVADYQEYNIYAHPEGYSDSILIQNYIYDSPGCLSYYKSGIDRTPVFLELFSDLYTLYPFHEEKYGHCQTQLGGGMEHQTMTTIGSFGFGLVAHELGHMWFGDNVTCATWMDIFINEGFATYSDYLANEMILGKASAQAWLSSRHAHVKSSPDGSIYVPEEDIDDVGRIFSGRLSYSKGAIILHMLRFEIGDDDLFFQIFQDFQTQYTDSTATGDDFREVAENVTGMDLNYFFDQWYYGEGYPIFDITWNYHSDSLRIFSLQSASTSVTPFFEMNVPFLLYLADGSDTTIYLRQTNNNNRFAVAFNIEVDSVFVDPDQWVLHQISSLHFVIEDLENPVSFSIQPNPGTDNVRLSFSMTNNEPTQIQILDIAGKLLYEETTNNQESIINIENLSQGFYVISAESGKNKFSRKFLKK